MKKLLIVLCVLMLSISNAEARSHGWHHGGHWRGPSYHFAPHHHHHHGRDVATGLAIGLIGGTILNNVLSQPRVVSTTAYSPVVYTPAATVPTVVSTPHIVSMTTVATTSSPCYTTSNIVTGATTTQCSSTIVTGLPVTTQMWIAN